MSTVVYCCPFVPVEWVQAHEVRAACWGFAGRWRDGEKERRRDGVGEAVAAVKSEIRHPKSEIGQYSGVCPFARGFAEAALATEADGVIVTTACDQMRRIGDWLEENCPRPVFLMNVPSTCSAAARELYASEVRRLGEFLVEIGGETPTGERLGREMVEREALRNASNRAPTSEEVGHPAVALVGGPLLAEDGELFEMIVQAGGTVVLDGTEGGERSWPGEFDRARMAADPFAELVRAYFEVIPDPFRRPDELLHAWLKREIAARGVRGVILHRYVWCDNWQAEVYRLKETLGVPVLDLDNAGAGDGRARVQARIEAFMETLG